MSATWPISNHILNNRVSPLMKPRSMTMVVGVGFEPTYATRADLQSAAFNHSATPPEHHLYRCILLAKTRRPCELKRHSSFVNKEVSICPQKSAKNIFRQKTGHKFGAPPRRGQLRSGHQPFSPRPNGKEAIDPFLKSRTITVLLRQNRLKMAT